MIGSLIVALVLMQQWADRDDSAVDEDDSETVAVSPTVVVVYEVEGSAGGADITLQTPTGTEQVTADLPLMSRAGLRGLRFDFPRGAFVYLSAQKDDVGGVVRCRITVDGYVVSENESTAAYGIASCQGRA